MPDFVEFDPGYFPSIEQMTKKQVIFYNYFKSEINQGNRVEIHENKSYPYLLSYEYLGLLNKNNDHHFNITPKYPELNKSLQTEDLGIKHIPYSLELLDEKCKFSVDETISKLTLLSDFYDYLDFTNWIGDIYCFAGRFQEALKTYKLNPKNIQTHLANKILNLKNYLGINVSPPELLCINKKITKWGYDNFDKIVEFVTLVLNEEEHTRGIDYLKYISEKYIYEKKYF